MTNRTRTGIVLLVVAQGLAGCGGSGALSTPSAPSPVPQPTPIQLLVFTDRVSGLSTSDVRDVQEQIVRFNSVGELIWAADGTRFPGYPVVQGSFIKADFSFQVRFGTKDGERRAYFAQHDRDFVYDLEVVGDQLVITETNVPVPGT